MTATALELLQRIVDGLDPDELCDRLGISTDDLVAKFADQILNSRELFEDFDD